MRVKSILTALLLMVACMQTAWAQKVVLYMEGNQTFECYVSQVDSIKFEEGELTHGITDGHEWVDLGLPSGTLWATCNVGSNSPEEYGSYFAWGETMQKSNYYWSTYKYCRGTEDTMTKYCTSSQYGTYGTIDEISELQPTDDAATVNWSSNWQMPSKKQIDELRTECNWTWTTKNEVNGYLVESKKNDMSIFLPAGGYCYDLATSYVGSRGYYWSRELRKTFPNQAYFLYIVSDSRGSGFDVRCYGRSVRPVRVQDTTPAKLVTAIVLSDEAISLQVNETKTLTATVEPSDADNSAVTWKSSNEAVATVSNEGLVTAVSEGTCTITCCATDESGVKAECQVTVTEVGVSLCPDDHHPHAIDLGLPSGTKWCCCNVGASAPEGYGGYYAWGETSEKITYNHSNYIYLDYISYYYKNIGSDIAGTDYDVAHVCMGAPWRMPSVEQMAELVSNCSCQWIQQNGFDGILVTGSNGVQIFLPAAGARWDNELRYAGRAGYYWSSSHRPNEFDGDVYLMFFYSDMWKCPYQTDRYCGYSIRAVRP